MIETEIAIVGAGIAGASLGAALAGDARLLLLEAESQPGYHTTGRSAAFFSETYGGPLIQPLTTASEAELVALDCLQPRGCLHIAREDDAVLLASLREDFAGAAVLLDAVDRSGLERRIPGLREPWRAGLAEPSCRDIDVARLHQHYLKQVRLGGGGVLCDAEVRRIERSDGRWRIETAAGVVMADIVVNAAGAWASEVARMAGAQPIAILPYRRTVVQLAVDPPVPIDLPLIMDVAGHFYMKPESGRLWISPHDETLAPASDAAAEEWDVAVAIDRFEAVVDWRIVRRERAWAGLRSFAPDRLPVYGFDRRAPGFFWFAGQGGFGIQTAPAAAAIAAALVLDSPLPEFVGAIDVGRYLPRRFP